MAGPGKRWNEFRAHAEGVRVEKRDSARCWNVLGQGSTQRSFFKASDQRGASWEVSVVHVGILVSSTAVILAPLFGAAGCYCLLGVRNPPNYLCCLALQ